MVLRTLRGNARTAYAKHGSLTDVLPNSYNDANYWGPSDYNVPQALTVSYTYNLPMRINHPNWGKVNSNPLSSTFMMVTSKLGSRNL